MFCHLVTLWLPRWFSAKIFACDCSSSKKMFWNHFDGWKTRLRHAVHAFFLYLPWLLSYLQHCHKTENCLMIKHYRKVLQRRSDNWILSFRYGVLLTGYASASKNPDGTSFGLLWQPQTEADRAKLIKGVTMRNKPDPPPPPTLSSWWRCSWESPSKTPPWIQLPHPMQWLNPSTQEPGPLD